MCACECVGILTRMDKRVQCVRALKQQILTYDAGWDQERVIIQLSSIQSVERSSRLLVWLLVKRA